MLRCDGDILSRVEEGIFRNKRSRENYTKKEELNQSSTILVVFGSYELRIYTRAFKLGWCAIKVATKLPVLS